VKLRTTLSDADLKVLADLFRSHVVDLAKSEELYYKVLDGEAGTVDPAVSQEIASGLRDGWVRPGLLSSLLSFSYVAGSVPGPETLSFAPCSPIPDLKGLPLHPGTDAFDLFFFLFNEFRSRDEVELRWPFDLWRYFETDPMRPYGYAVERDPYGKMRLIPCAKK
jgi:hypothetical protein